MQIDAGRSYTNHAVHCEECPISYITERSRMLIQMESANQQTVKSAGACLFGTDAGAWPAIWHDVVTTIQAQRMLDEEAYRRSL